MSEFLPHKSYNSIVKELLWKRSSPWFSQEGIACMFAVAPAFAADNDLGIQQRKLTNRTGSTRGFRVASWRRKKHGNSKLNWRGFSREKIAWLPRMAATSLKKTKQNSLDNRTRLAKIFTKRSTMLGPLTSANRASNVECEGKIICIENLGAGCGKQNLICIRRQQNEKVPF